MTDDEDSADLCTPFERVSNTGQDLHRGQVDARFAIRAFIILVLAVPLATAAVDISSSLAATPTFTWFSATVIALLIMAVMVAAALGGDSR